MSSPTTDFTKPADGHSAFGSEMFSYYVNVIRRHQVPVGYLCKGLAFLGAGHFTHISFLYAAHICPLWVFLPKGTKALSLLTAEAHSACLCCRESHLLLPRAVTRPNCGPWAISGLLVSYKPKPAIPAQFCIVYGCFILQRSSQMTVMETM